MWHAHLSFLSMASMLRRAMNCCYSFSKVVFTLKSSTLMREKYSHGSWWLSSNIRSIRCGSPSSLKTIRNALQPCANGSMWLLTSNKVRIWKNINRSRKCQNREKFRQWRPKFKDQVVKLIIWSVNQHLPPNYCWLSQNK